MVATRPHPDLCAERRDLLARALRDMLAERLVCHPRRLGGLRPEVVAAMLHELADATPAERLRLRRDPRPTPTVVTPAWDRRAG